MGHGVGPRIQPLARYDEGWEPQKGVLMFLEAVTAAAGALAVQTLVVYVVCVGGFEEREVLILNYY